MATSIVSDCSVKSPARVGIRNSGTERIHRRRWGHPLTRSSENDGDFLKLFCGPPQYTAGRLSPAVAEAHLPVSAAGYGSCEMLFISQRRRELDPSNAARRPKRRSKGDQQHCRKNDRVDPRRAQRRQTVEHRVEDVRQWDRHE